MEVFDTDHTPNFREVYDSILRFDADGQPWEVFHNALRVAAEDPINVGVDALLLQATGLIKQLKPTTDDERHEAASRLLYNLNLRAVAVGSKIAFKFNDYDSDEDEKKDEGGDGDDGECKDCNADPKLLEGNRLEMDFDRMYGFIH